MKTRVLAAVAAACLASSSAIAAPVSDADIVDGYEYLLSRHLVLRQEKADLKEGVRWNEMVHRAPGGVAWANPNLDVAYSEAWVAVDDKSCTLVNVPDIKGRYYTIQVLNGWGEVTANINERNYPNHPSGTFALCLKGANVALPAGAERIDLPGKQSRILSRVELGSDPDAAIALQKQITLKATGAPTIDPPVASAEFAAGKLPGVEAFDNVDTLLASEPDAAGMAGAQAKARAVAAAIAENPAERARVEDVVRTKAAPQFMAGLKNLGASKNGWTRPRVTGNYGDDYRMRSLANYAGIWANNQKEVVYFMAGDLDGSATYAMTFPANELPESKVGYFWSVIAVDTEKFQVIANPLNRFLLNKQSGLQPNADGSLTLAFAPSQPADVPAANWLPTPTGEKYNLTFRFYGPSADVVNGTYFPPPLQAKPVTARSVR